MCGILKSLGINFSPNEYTNIIRECFNIQRNLHFDNENSETEIDDNNATTSRNNPIRIQIGCPICIRFEEDWQ